MLNAIAASFPEAVLLFSGEGRLEAFNAAAGVLTGLSAEAGGEVTLAELLGDAPERARDILSATLARSEPSHFRLALYGPPGGRSALRGHSWRMEAAGRTMVAIRLFESEAGQHRRVLARIANGLRESRKLPIAECQASSLAAVITEVCAFTGWAYAEVWMPSAAPEQWVPHPFWYGSRERYQRFRMLSVKAAAAAPLPLVSRVAREQTSMWYSDVSTVPLAVYRRARAARDAGLKATFAQPVVAGGRTLAVLVFMMAEARACDDTLADLMAESARQLAPLLRGGQAEQQRLQAAVPRGLPGQRPGERPRRDLDLLCRLLEVLGTPAIITQEDGSVVWANAAACRAFRYSLDELCRIPAARLYVDERAFEESGARASPLLKADRPFRHRLRMQRKDGTRFAAEHLVVPLGQIMGNRLSVSLVADLSDSAKLTFGRRLEQLTQREQEVFQLTIVGATTTEIAARLSLSVRTVETHRSHLLRKLGCASTTKLLAELLADSIGERALP